MYSRTEFSLYISIPQFFSLFALEQRTHAEMIERETADKGTRLNSKLLSDTASHRSVIALWTVEAVLYPRGKRRSDSLDDIISRTVPYTNSHAHLHIKSFALRIFNTSSHPLHPSLCSISQMLARSLMYPPFSIIIFHPRGPHPSPSLIQLLFIHINPTFSQNTDSG